MTRRFAVLLEWDAADHVWVSYVPELNHMSSYGDTREQVLSQTKEAIVGYLEAAAKEGIPVPLPDLQPELVDLEVAV